MLKKILLTTGIILGLSTSIIAANDNNITKPNELKIVKEVDNNITIKKINKNKKIIKKKINKNIAKSEPINIFYNKIEIPTKSLVFSQKEKEEYIDKTLTNIENEFNTIETTMINSVNLNYFKEKYLNNKEINSKSLKLSDSLKEELIEFIEDKIMENMNCIENIDISKKEIFGIKLEIKKCTVPTNDYLNNLSLTKYKKNKVVEEKQENLDIIK